MSAFIEKNENEIKIGNEFISRTFILKNKKINTESIVNRRTDKETVFIPAEGSSDFVVSIICGFISKVVIKSADLFVEAVNEKDCDNGKTLEISYKPYSVKGVDLSFREVYKVFDNKHYIYKNIYMKASGKNVSKIKLDFIDGEHFVLDKSVEQSWSRPDMSKAHISGFLVALGQPVYINGMFFGNEFPE